MKNKSLTMLKKYLEAHEMDIVLEVNDFSYLAYLFKDVMGRPPADSRPKGIIYRYGHHPDEAKLDT